MNDVTISTPGKIILHGEHSVVYGKPAIACSLNIRTYLKLRQTSDTTVSLILPDIGITRLWSLDDLKQILLVEEYEVFHPKPPTEQQLIQLKDFLELETDPIDTSSLAIIVFLYTYLSLFKNDNLQSVEVRVKSELPIGAGLGSSAGYSVCVSTALLLLTGVISPPTEDNVWKLKDLELINKWAFIGESLFHGKPSGIDNSIATYGKAIKFKAGNICKLDKMPNLRVLLINTKVPRSTKDLVYGVRKKFEQYKNIVKPVLDSMEAIVNKTEDVLSMMLEAECDMVSSYQTLQDLIDMNHDLLRFLGVSHPSLDLVCSICQENGLHCKLTGAGGGGCAFCLIPPETTEDDLLSIKTALEKQNFECWETSVGGNGIMLHNDITAIPELLLK